MDTFRLEMAADRQGQGTIQLQLLEMAADR